MANKDAAFGLRAIGKVGQNKDNQGLSEYSIAASATAIYQGDPVEILATGTIGVAAAGDALLGPLNGVFFTDASTSKPTFANHLKASNTATDIVGFVSDDPYERFEVQSTGATAAADVGLNADISYTAGSSPSFVSKVELDQSDQKTGTAQLRIIGISKDPDNNEAGSANVNLVTIINEHQLKGTTGV
jgi:hypothetical protein|tara:strand:- start:5 stop:568 length:564 start_codon:yes stop_codon:yes gene_type:complete